MTKSPSLDGDPAGAAAAAHRRHNNNLDAQNLLNVSLKIQFTVFYTVIFDLYIIKP